MGTHPWGISDNKDTMDLGDRAHLALQTIYQEKTKGVPSLRLHIMQHDHIEYFAGAQPGDYVKTPEKVYLQCQQNLGACLVDQYIPRNPLTMDLKGLLDGTVKSSTTGAEEIYLDGMLIDSPETVIEHIEKYAIPSLKEKIKTFSIEARAKSFIEEEKKAQQEVGKDILKSTWGLMHPRLGYERYGYVNYFMAYALYPEMIEKFFSVQADYALLNNTAVAHGFKEEKLPPLCRFGHDMADSRDVLVDIRSLDKMWFPHFSRCIEPVVKAGIKLIWHCDGNLMQMVPRLLEAGLNGFQGFQYECGMDYPKICKMKDRNGDSLIIFAGVSVTQTLPSGTVQDIKKELQWLVENGPQTGLFLGTSSSVAPGVPLENLKALAEGLAYYRTHGRNG